MRRGRGVHNEKEGREEEGEGGTEQNEKPPPNPLLLPSHHTITCLPPIIHTPLQGGENQVYKEPLFTLNSVFKEPDASVCAYNPVFVCPAQWSSFFCVFQEGYKGRLSRTAIKEGTKEGTFRRNQERGEGKRKDGRNGGRKEEGRRILRKDGTNLDFDPTGDPRDSFIKPML
jgi:hypothetical protein